jgi:hypothetical protein
MSKTAKEVIAEFLMDFEENTLEAEKLHEALDAAGFVIVPKTDVDRLREIERQAIAEGCNIGSVPEAPVWLVNQRAETAERKLAALDAARGAKTER